MPSLSSRIARRATLATVAFLAYTATVRGARRVLP